MEGTVANLEKHPQRPVEQIEQADFSTVPTHARSPHVLGSYIKNRQDNDRGRVSGREHEAQAVILRLEDSRHASQYRTHTRTRQAAEPPIGRLGYTVSTPHDLRCCGAGYFARLTRSTD
jgi:hypothetical protein